MAPSCSPSTIRQAEQLMRRSVRLADLAQLVHYAGGRDGVDRRIADLAVHELREAADRVRQQSEALSTEAPF